MIENLFLRKAKVEDAKIIWNLLQIGILKRKEDGSDQWQDGYPNPTIVLDDIVKGYGIVAIDPTDKIVAYIAMIDQIEPAYEDIKGKWLSNQPYVVLHRLIVDLDNPIKGLATWMMKSIEELVVRKGIDTIKVDTNFDNRGMLRVFEKLAYQFCGKVYFRGKERLAFEKRLN